MHTPLLGRDEELRTLGGSADDAAAGRGGVILLTGEAGIGKSRLLRELEPLLQQKGFQTAWGRAWEAGGAPAFWPWMEVYRGLGRPWGAQAVELNAQGRFARFDAMARDLDAMAHERPLGILLDDLHVADEASLLFVKFLGSRIASMRCLVVAASREARGVYEALGRERAMTLRRLSLADLGALGDCAASVHARSEGLPLFVEELLRTGDDAPAPRLQAILDAHLDTLSAPTREVLGEAAVVGRGFRLDELARSGPELAAARAAIGEAHAAGVIEPGTGPEFRFGHVLLRDRLYAQLDPVARDAAHRVIGEAFAARGCLAEAAHHLLCGVGTGDGPRAAGVALDAARAEHRRLAFESAASLARRALDVPGLPTPLSVALRLTLAESFLATGRVDDGRAESDRAFEEAAAAALPDEMARAALVHGKVLFTARVNPRLLHMLQTAIDAGPAPQLMPILLARLAAAHVPPDSDERARWVVETATHAAELARGLGGRDAADLPAGRRRSDPQTGPARPGPRTGPPAPTHEQGRPHPQTGPPAPTHEQGRPQRAVSKPRTDREVLLDTLRYAGPAFGYLVDQSVSLTVADELFALARALDRPDVVAEIAGITFAFRLAAGRVDASEALVELERAVARLSPVHHWRLAATQGTGALWRGDIAAARRCVDQLAAAAEAGGAQMLGFVALRVGLALREGDPTAIVADVDESRLVGPALLFRPWLLAAAGRGDEARAAGRAVLAGPGGFPQLITVGATAVLARDAALAAQVRGPLAGWIGRNEYFFGPGGTLCFGPTTEVVAALDALLGHAPQAPAATPARVVLARHGELWTLDLDGVAAGSLPDVKGMAYLARLLAEPNREVHVFELLGVEHAAGDAGPILDDTAMDDYRRRAAELRTELAQAEAWADLGRAQVARDELEALRDELVRAAGLGGRARRAKSDAERARVNVQRRLKDAIDRVERLHPAVGAQLRRAVRTGLFCVYGR